MLEVLSHFRILIIQNMANSIQFPHGDLPLSYFTEYRGHILVGVGVTFMVLDSIAFFLRVLSRRLNRISMVWDDILVIPALIFNLALNVILMRNPASHY